MSGVHFHPARFISQLPSILVSRLSDPGQVVLDPFCGSGTTLTEAQRLGRRAIGCDINPVSILISRAKTTQLGSGRVRESLLALVAAAAGADAGDRNLIPASVQTEKWYSPSIAAGLGAMHAHIQATTDDEERVIKRLCFSSVLLKSCRETRHWGYVCDNTRPVAEPDRNLIEILDRSVGEIVEAFEDRDDALPPATVIETPAKLLDQYLEQESVDLVVTSPPYEGVVDYVKSQRLTLEWLDLEVEQLRLREIGARSKRHRLKATSEFGEELKESFQTVYGLLKPGGACTVVFGVSPHRSFTFEHLLTIMGDIGFKLVRDHLRDVSLQRRLMPSVLTERLFVFVKP
jgi:SAM-dependent methyltransferase